MGSQIRGCEMRYNRQLRRAIYRCPEVVLDQLRMDFQLIEINIRKGMPWELEKKRFGMRMWLGDICDWAYWGGTNVVPADKNIHNNEPDKSWVRKIEKACGEVVEKTNRTVFGRRYFRKVAYPTSLAFYERGDKTDGKHIHTLHHFPLGTVDRASTYLECFTGYWNEHRINKGVGRTFWYEPVIDQDKAMRYATKKMTSNYEFGWFAFG
jgi:hypothetical protein